MKLVQPVTILIIRQSEYLKDFFEKTPCSAREDKKKKRNNHIKIRIRRNIIPDKPAFLRIKFDGTGKNK